MALPLWGELEKAQDDDQSIVAYVAQAIAEHEADPEAHLGAGESLEMHKSEDVIDHPPGCILPDKISFSDISFDTTFESLSGFAISSGVTNTSWPGVIFDIFDGGGDVRTLRANVLGIINSGDIEFDVLMDTYFSIDSEDSNEIIHIGLTDTANSVRYLGFKIDGGEVYGYARYGGTTYYTDSLYTISGTELVFVRVYYDYGADVIRFYVNGVELGTIEPSSAVSTSNQFGVYCADNGAESTVFRIFRWTLSRSI